MIYFLLITLLMIIAFQDIKSRSIHWITIPLLFILSLIWNRSNLHLLDISKNILFLVTTLGLLVVYLRFRLGDWVNPMKDHFGIGDILFLFAICPITSFTNFVLSFTMGTLFCLILHFITLIFNRKNQSIPYAGYFSLFLILFVSLKEFYHLTPINLIPTY